MTETFSPGVRVFMDDLSRSLEVIMDLYVEAARDATTTTEIRAINQSLHVLGWMLIARAYVLHINPVTAAVRISLLAEDLRREINLLEAKIKGPKS